MLDRYPWIRYWCPRGAPLRTDDDGFLLDPESGWGKMLRGDLVQLHEIENPGAVLLLGEPGLGKSDAMREAERTRASEADSVIYAPVLQTVNSARQVQEIFAHETVRAWATAGIGRLHLYLDALDECFLRVDVLGPLLIEELRPLPLSRLRIYLSCRTAEWPTSFEQELRKLLGKSGVDLAAFELAPLRRRDVETAATMEGLDAAELLAAIDRHGAAPLAMKPVTLRLLLRTFSSDSVPSSQLDLYRLGMRALITESAHRRETHLAGRLEPGERLAIAQRIAALTIFTGRSSIERDAEQSPAPGVLPIWEIAEGHETANGRELAVTESAVNEVLDTGLFSLRGERHFGWAHQTYAEYLAAAYLHERGITPSQVASLVQAADGHVIPQLHGVAAWIAAVSDVMFPVIAASDPDILVAADVVLPSSSQREKIVRDLLRRAGEGVRLDVLQARKLGKLAHDGLPRQLAPYLAGRVGSEGQRDLALDIAIFSKDPRLLEDVVTLALDQAAPLHLRHTAAAGLISFGSAELRGRLKPLIDGEHDDPEEQLNWLGMQAAWPGSLTPDELFQALKKRKPTTSLQAYSVFPVREIANGFSEQTLPAGMRWAAKREQRLGARYQRRHSDSLLDDLVDALLLRAWPSLDNKTVMQCFTRIAWSRLKRWENIVGSIYGRDFNELVSEDDGRRLHLATALLATCDDVNVDVQRLLMNSNALLVPKDVPWLAARVKGAEDDLLRDAAAVALVRLSDQTQPTHFEAILDVLDVSTTVAERYGWIRDVVDLQSARADEMRRAHVKAEAERRKQERAQHRGPTAKDLRKALASVTAEKPEQWWRFAFALALSDEKPDFGDVMEHDLTKLPGWSKLESTDIQSVVDAAELYLRHAKPKPEEWLGQQLFHYGAAAGVKAFVLLSKLAPHRLAALPKDVWETWAIAIIGVSSNAAELPMLREACAHAPATVLDAIDIVVQSEGARESSDLRLVRVLGPIWDTDVATRLAAHLRGTVLHAGARATVLETLLEHKQEDARSYAEGLLAPIPAKGSEAWPAAVRAAVQLLSHVPELAWSAVSAAMQDVDFADAVIELAAHEDQFGGAMLARFTEEQLGAFFERVATRFPSSADPQHPKMKAISPGLRDDIARWRSMLLTSLMHRGTSAALDAIRHAIKALPNERYLPRALREAEAKWRERTWRPIAPAQLLALARNTELRFVDNAIQLSTVIGESLARFQARLHGETPLVSFLWNEYRIEKTLSRRPKTEPQLSDLMKVFLDLDLRQRGIIVNREVQIRPTIAAGTGEITDIHVDAAAVGNKRDRIVAIVEVKGCWNDELFTAMRTQLRDRYLKNNDDASGIYCVGWFQCAAWDSADRRKRSTRSLRMEDVRRKLDLQARRLSDGNRITAVVLDVRLPDAAGEPVTSTKQRASRRKGVGGNRARG